MNVIVKTGTVFIATFAAGLVGMLFVNTGVGSWYAGTIKPPLSPTEAFFPLAWVVLYVLMAGACSLAWNKDPQNSHTEGWVRFYFIQLFLNAGWTIFFFGYHNITFSFMETLVLAFFVITLSTSGYEIDKRIAYLMLPYCLWIVFALYFVGGIWLLN